MNKRNELTVFVSDHCFNCKDSRVIAEELKQRYPEVDVRVFNVDNRRPDVDIFGVPTYALNGKIVFLGNPTEKQIETLFSENRSASVTS